MLHFSRELRACLMGLLALMGLAAAPATSRAAWLGLRNDTAVPILVQACCVVNNKPCPGKPMMIYPGEVAWDCVLQPCVKDLVIYDAKTKQKLFETQLPCGASDLFLSTQMQAPGQIKLVPTRPPMPPPHR